MRQEHRRAQMSLFITMVGIVLIALAIAIPPGGNLIKFFGLLVSFALLITSAIVATRRK